MFIQGPLNSKGAGNMSMVYVIDEISAVIQIIEKLPVLILMVGILLVSLVLWDI